MARFVIPSFCLTIPFVCVSPAVPGGYPSPCYQPDRRIQWQPRGQPDVQSTGHQRKTCKQSPSVLLRVAFFFMLYTDSPWARMCEIPYLSSRMPGCHLAEIAAVGLLSSWSPSLCSSHAPGGRQWGSYRAEELDTLLVCRGTLSLARHLQTTGTRTQVSPSLPPLTQQLARSPQDRSYLTLDWLYMDKKEKVCGC